jgi:hypothetical protein
MATFAIDSENNIAAHAEVPVGERSNQPKWSKERVAGNTGGSSEIAGGGSIQNAGLSGTLASPKWPAYSEV